MKKILKIATNLIWAALIVFLMLVGATFLPIPGNYKLYTVRSGSMEPKIRTGSLVFSKPAGTYGIGDVITFKSGGGKSTTTHRIVEKKETENGTGFVTKGDANEDPDPEAVSFDNIVGKTFLTLPLLGYPIAYAQTKVGFIFLIIVPSVIIIYEELRNIATETKKKFQSMKSRKTEKEENRTKKYSRYASDNFIIKEIQVGLQNNWNYAPPQIASPLRKRKIV